uniref:Reverse transcriptase zinc-binding domain-containing protein n=1 Tax=Fagus sylvatica TaxID=28930 RepID=A0A2N9G4J9_FAGSY
MEEQADQDDVNRIIALTNKLGWNKGKVSLEVDPNSTESSRLMLIVPGNMVHGRPEKGKELVLHATYWSTADYPAVHNQTQPQEQSAATPAVMGDEGNDVEDDARAEKTKKSPMAAQNQYQLKPAMMKHLLVIFFTHWSRWTALQTGPRQHQLKQRNHNQGCHGHHHSRAMTTTAQHSGGPCSSTSQNLGSTVWRQYKENLLRVGGFIGRALEVDLVGTGNGSCRKFVRVRVEFDITQPLVTGLGHEQTDCKDPDIQLLLKDNKKYGIFDKWLRADNDCFQSGIQLKKIRSHELIEGSTSTQSLEQMEGGCILPSGSISQSYQNNSWQKSVQWDLQSWNAMKEEQVAREPSTFDEGDNAREVMEELSCPESSTSPRNDPNGRGGGPYQAPPLTMRILAWNCRGASRAPTVRAIKALSRDSCPDVIFLAESKSPHSRMEDVRLKLGFESLFCEEAKGLAGGPGMMIGDLNCISSSKDKMGAIWTRDESSVKVVEEAWNILVEGSQSFKLAKKQRRVCQDFKKWNCECFSYTRSRIKELEALIANLQQKTPSQENLEMEAALMMELEEWQERDELKWRQKSRELWLKEGDQNSRFFHLSTIIRRRRNYINEIKANDGSWLNSRKDIGDYFTAKFIDLYQSQHPQFPPNLEDLIEACISDAENEALCSVLSEYEIKRAVFEMNPLKAPGPDGLPGLFYKHYWSIVGSQVIAAVQGFFREGWLLKEFNRTFITLIPKAQGACNFNQFRPISLCNVYYKIISKILVTRLRPLLNRLIDPAQVAFVPNIWITENVVAAQEIVHSFRRTQKKKVQYSLLLNGSSFSTFSPSRGLRQGVKVARNAQPVSKLCYADDVILFCKAKFHEVNSLVRCINTYCEWSGQKVSIEKSGFFTSKGVHAQFTMQLRNTWGFKKLPQHTKYLGVPLFLSNNKTKDFHYFQERLESRLSGWKSKNLSWMGRATQIKSVAQSTPIYSMAAFKIPKSICDCMDSLIRRFWWSPKKESSHYLAPLSWASLCKSKKDGGLGFRKFWDFNLAMLSKFAWWILVGKESQCVQLLRAKYKCAYWSVGDGKSILVWEDPWVPECPNFRPRPLSEESCNMSLAVNYFFNQEGTNWDNVKLQETFDQDSVKKIKAISVCSKYNQDRWIWTKSCHGNHTVKSAYWTLNSENQVLDRGSTKGNVWGSKLHERLKMHLWRIDVDILPTRMQLARFASDLDIVCPLCELAPESSLHLFQQCHVSQVLWFGSPWGLKIANLQFSSPSQLVDFVVRPPHDLFLDKSQQDQFTLYAALLIDYVWSLRNKVVHGGDKPNRDVLGRGLWNRFIEHWSMLSKSDKSPSSYLKEDIHWMRPVRNGIKLNCDAAVGVDGSIVAGIARDWRGSLVFAFAFKFALKVIANHVLMGC